jgi:hypothetical protein
MPFSILLLFLCGMKKMSRKRRRSKRNAAFEMKFTIIAAAAAASNLFLEGGINKNK